MGDILAGVTPLGIIMGFLAVLIGFLAFFFGLNSIRWVFQKGIPKDAIGFGLTLGVASFIAGIAWPIFLISQDYRIVGTLIIISELFYIFYSLGGRTSSHS